MPDFTEFQVHDIAVSESPRFTPQGTVSDKNLTFFVGSHGPFHKTYSPAIAGTADTIKADIQKQVDELRSIASITAGV